jgi:hypothetical protein
MLRCFTGLAAMAAVLGFMTVGCSGTSGGGSANPEDSGAPPVGDGGSQPDGPGTRPIVDAAPPPPDPHAAAACDTACTQLATCGATFMDHNSCVMSCEQSAVMPSCFENSASDCNSLSLCIIKDTCATTCTTGTACMPAGSNKCSAASDCLGRCLNNDCICGCLAGLDPAKASVLVNEQTCFGVCNYATSCEIGMCQQAASTCVNN